MKNLIAFVTHILGVYGIIGVILGLLGGFPHPCDHNTIANITSCVASDTFGEFIYDIKYIDNLNKEHTGKIKSNLGCTNVKYISLCYGSYDPGNFKNGHAVFSNYKAPIGLFISGVTSVGLFLIGLCVHMCISPNDYVRMDTGSTGTTGNVKYPHIVFCAMPNTSPSPPALWSKV